MSRRAERSNGVRGPTSALTSYLREQGITTGPISVYSRRINREGEGANEANGSEQNEENDNAEVDMNAEEAGPSTSHQRSHAGPSQPKRRKRNDSDSDGLDEEVQTVVASSKKRRGSLAKEKAKAKAAAKPQDKDEEAEDFNAFSSKQPRTSPRPPNGSLEKCAHCGKKFPITKYTRPASSGHGYLCHNCVKASGSDPFKKTVPQKRQNAREKRSIKHFEDKERVGSLAQLCIKVISTHIHDVEALGDIGTTSLDAISKIIARNRSLTAQNALLFYDVENTTLTMYDCTSLVPDALCTLASLNPKLESVRLDYCGRMNDAVLVHWSKALQHVKKVDLLGPFNVRSSGWIAFAEGTAQPLTGLCITQSPRFDMDCLQALLTRCQESLIELRLSEFAKLADEWLPTLASFQRLQFLDISYPATSISEEALIQLLAAIGENLFHLNISGNGELGNPIIESGLRLYMKNLVTLRASHLPLLTDDGVADLFSKDGDIPTMLPPLEIIDLSRAPDVGSNALMNILSHSGSNLRELNINGWKGTSNEALVKMGVATPLLRKLDVGWCRFVDNFVLKSILDGCKNIQEILCAGCNRVTVDCPKKYGVAIRGMEVV